MFLEASLPHKSSLWPYWISVVAAWLFFIAFITIADAHASEGVLWETRTKMRMPGRGLSELPVQKTCGSQQSFDVKMLKAMDKNCAVTRHETKGDTLTFEQRCAAATVNGTITKKSAHLFQGMMTSKTPQGEYQFEFSAKRLGSCAMDEDVEV